MTSPTSLNPPPQANDEAVAARELVRVVLALAVGSSITPFVPLPFVDDYLFARLLRRIAWKVIERAAAASGASPDDRLPKAVVEGYVAAGDTGLGEKAMVAATRFVMRKVAVVLDVKRSHDVFGESISFALALDTAVRAGALNTSTAGPIGAAIYRAAQSVGSAALELLTRAGREAFAGAPTIAENPSPEAAPVSGTRDLERDSSRFARVGSAIGRQVDETRKHLDHLMKYEISQLSQHMR